MHLIPAAQQFRVGRRSVRIGTAAAQAALQESAGDSAQAVERGIGEPLRVEGLIEKAE